MLSTILLTAAGCCVPGYFALRWAWREGYRDGVADTQLGLHDALTKALRAQATPP